MGYLFCEKCGGYYELKAGESVDDFKSFKCECGGKLKYVESLDETSSDGIKLNLKCPFCGSGNLTQNKFCDSCGKPLDGKIGLKDEDIKKPNYNKVARGFLIAIIIIAFISILPWLTSNITDITNSIYPNHYDNGVISFDYPGDFEASNDTNIASKINKSQQYYGYVFNQIAGLSTPTKSDDESSYWIEIYILSKKTTVEIPINKTEDQIKGIDSEGNYELTQVSVSSGETRKENIDVLQSIIDNSTTIGSSTIGSITVGEPKKYIKNGYNYYEWEPLFEEGSWINRTYYQTIIEKEDYPYLFLIKLQVNYPYGRDGGDAKGFNAYQKVLDTFKIG